MCCPICQVALQFDEVVEVGHCHTCQQGWLIETFGVARAPRELPEERTDLARAWDDRGVPAGAEHLLPGVSWSLVRPRGLRQARRGRRTVRIRAGAARHLHA